MGEYDQLGRNLREIVAFEIPIVFIIFNRPHLTVKVFEAIAQVQPSRLFIIADGPRDNQKQDIKKCAETRSIINRVDWECEVLTDFSDVNLGCKKRVSSGIDWAFSMAEELIILEDDCLPSSSFFSYCRTLLRHYRDDTRVMAISGDNFQKPQKNLKYSYYFSKYFHCWGWATWRRAWNHFDLEMNTWPELKESGFLEFLSKDDEEYNYWINIFDRVYQGGIDSWAFIWFYNCISQSGFTILPSANLVSNIGFGNDASNTVESGSPLANIPTTEINKIFHPPFVIVNQKADEYTFNSIFSKKRANNGRKTAAELLIWPLRRLKKLVVSK